MKNWYATRPTTGKVRGFAWEMLCGLALFPMLAGCAMQNRPHAAPALVFRHCAVTSELPGFIGCDCIKPLIVWDAQLKRKIVYCDGKVQQ